MARTQADFVFKHILSEILKRGEKITTRNHDVIRHINLQNVTFDQPPLVTYKKTAWKKALREWEWFLSGDPKCPDELLDWWGGQLHPDGSYYCGYGEQLRFSPYSDGCGWYNQIQGLIDGIIHSPFSRRHVITTWNPGDMSSITRKNNNPLTPSTCHTSFAQFFVDEDNLLHMKSYARSQDILLGTPHNWIQSWAFLEWVANRTLTDVGTLTWLFGDTHLYYDVDHFDVARAIIDDKEEHFTNSYKMIYQCTSDEFKAHDFKLVGNYEAKPLLERKLKIF